MNLLPFQAVYPNLAMISSPISFFGTVKNRFPEYMKSGFFLKAAQEGVYIYQIRSEIADFISVISCAHIEDYINGNVLKHEYTLAAKEQNMMQVVLQNRAMVKPILLAHEPADELTDFLSEFIKSNDPFFNVDFEESGEQHTVWSVTEGTEVERLKSIFKLKIKKTYIADGHHRASTAIALYNNKNTAYIQEDMEGVLSVFISFDNLRIYDYNRVFEVLREVPPVEFIVKLSKYCNIKAMRSPRKPSKKHHMTLLIADQWYKVKWKKKVLKAHKAKEVLLDAELLNKYVLHNICDIENIREDKRVTYIDGVSGIDGLIEKVNGNDFRLGICLYPVTIEELKTVADNGDTLPPKTTWFEPRIKNGMIVKEF